MAHNGDTEVDRALDAVVAEINGLTEGQDGGPPVVLTLGGLVIGGTIIPDWQWFDEVEQGPGCVHGAQRRFHRRRVRWLGKAVPWRQRVPRAGA
jgi:hypothetical protein